MKIAVASIDGVSISEHFGRSACFIVFDVSGSEVGEGVVRLNTSPAHTEGQCAGQHGHQHGKCNGDVLSGLQDCAVIICGGMGGGMAQELERRGIKPVIVQGAYLPKEAVQQYVEGKIRSDKPVCRCHH
ncbi:MAG: NifB/NifX family molybdenum-iron cluster-binding protein [Isosphaeraceae bacterium]